MGDMLQRGARMIERVRSTSLSHQVEYRPKCGQPYTLGATVDAIDEETALEGEIGDVRRRRDFLVAAADLDRKPVVGDVIRETIDGQAVDYEITTYGSDPCWAYDDTLNLRIRVHTRRKTA